MGSVGRMFSMHRLCVCFFLLSQPGFGANIKSEQFLSVEGDKFMYGGEHVYLSGTNAAWVQYGSDFGDDAWEHHGDIWKEELAKIGSAGGNSVRVWVHVEGDVSPLYDGDGFVVGTDRAGTLISDLTSFLDECAKNNIFMGLVLFNGAVLTNQDTIDLIWDYSKLETYLAKALTHLDWSRGGANSSDLRSQGPGWSGANIPVEKILRLHNWVAHTIHSLDPKALVSSGSWNSLASTNVKGDDPVFKTGFNHYSDECLYQAGARDKGVMDFTQFHTYTWQGGWGTEGPWTGNTGPDYGMNQPILVGEYPAKKFQEGEGEELPNGATTEGLVDYLYSNGFAGGFSWSFIPDDWSGHPGLEEDVLAGLSQLAGRTEHGKIEVEIS